MTADDWSVLDFVSATRLATGGQLVRRFWLAGDGAGSDARPGRRTLKRLRQWRVLDVLPRRVGGTRGGSDGLVYLVGVAGAKLLADRGVTPRRPDAPGARYVDHTLAICELVVQLHEAAGRGGLDLLAVETEPVCWRTFVGPLAARLTLKPDLFVRIGAGAYEDRWFIEVDLATEASGALVAKARRYLAHYRSGAEQREHGVYPRVLWAVPDRRRAEQLEVALLRLPIEARTLFSICLIDEAVDRLAREAAS